MKIISTLCLSLALTSSAYADVVYLSPFIGTGTEADAFRAHGVFPGPAKCIEINRPEPQTKVDRWAVCQAPALPLGAGVVELGASFTDTGISNEKIAALSSATKRSISGNTLGEMVGLAIDGTRTLKDKAGRVRVVVDGKELYSAASGPRARRPAPAPLEWLTQAFRWVLFPQTAWAASYSTGFDCANAAVLDCDGLTWTEAGGSNWSIASNQAVVTSSIVDRARMDSDLATADHEVELDVTAIGRGTATWVRVGPTARNSSAVTNSYDFCDVEDNSGGDTYVYGYMVAGVLTVSGTAAATAAPMTMKIRMVGDQITCFSDGVAVIGPTTHANVQTHLRGGLENRPSGATAAQTQVNRWAAQDYVGSSGALRRRTF